MTFDPETQRRMLQRALANYQGAKEDREAIAARVAAKLEKKRKLRAILLQRDGSCCYYCGRHLGVDMTIEHLHEKSRGGSDRIENLRLTHEYCNNAVQGLTVEEKLARAFFKG
jgi:hypothetical protein